MTGLASFCVKKIDTLETVNNSSFTNVHFAAATGQVEQQGDFKLTETLQVLCETFARELLQRVLIALGCLLHLSLLLEHETLRLACKEGKEGL